MKTSSIKWTCSISEINRSVGDFLCKRSLALHFEKLKIDSMLPELVPHRYVTVLRSERILTSPLIQIFAKFARWRFGFSMRRRLTSILYRISRENVFPENFTSIRTAKVAQQWGTHNKHSLMLRSCPSLLPWGGYLAHSSWADMRRIRTRRDAILPSRGCGCRCSRESLMPHSPVRFTTCLW